MSRRSVIESSESGREEIDYSSLTETEIARRVHAYQEKYGMTLAAWSRRFSCANATPRELLDLMDWECLVRERDERALARRPSQRR
jgi:hypothetical protein